MSPEDVVAENLKEEKNGLSRALMRRLAYLSEASAALLPDYLTDSDNTMGTLADIGASFLTAFQEAYRVSSDISEISRKETEAAFMTLRATDAAAFARRVTDYLRSGGKSIVPDYQTANGKIKVAMPAGRLSEHAFASALGFFPEAQAINVSGFSEAVKAVVEHEADMCLLPFENATGAKVSSVLSLTEEYELRILAMFTVQSGEEVLRFALLSDTPYAVRDGTGDKYISFRVLPSEMFPFSSFLIGTAALSVVPVMIDTEKRSSLGDSSYFCTFRCENREVAEIFSVFACLFTASFLSYGVYERKGAEP